MNRYAPDADLINQPIRERHVGDGSPRVVPPDPDLRRLADDSGGYFEVRAVENLGALFTRVAEELHRQYWIGFVPLRVPVGSLVP